VGVGSVPVLRSSIADLERHHSPRQVTGVLQAVRSFGDCKSNLSCVNSGISVDGLALGNSSHAGEHETTGGAHCLPFRSSEPRHNSFTLHGHVLVLLGSLSQSLELGNTTGRGFDCAETTRTRSSICENTGGINRTEGKHCCTV